jgi:hypothetical protein
VANPEKDHGASGAPVLRKARFTLRAWTPGQKPELTGPVFSGTPAFPFT